MRKVSENPSDSPLQSPSHTTLSKMTILFSTLKMALATLTSRLLGLVRELVMAALFGANGYTDAFLVAFRIPNLLRDLLAEGAFSSAFVPTFTEARQRSETEARELLWSLFWILTLVTGVIGLLYFIFAPQIVKVFAPDFPQDPQRFLLSIDLLRLMSPFLLCTSLAALFMGALNSLKVFFLPSLAPASANVFMIVTLFTLPPFLRQWGILDIYALAIGVLLGGLSQVLLQVPDIFRKNYGPLWPKTFLSPPAKKVIKLLGPGLIGFTATQLNVLVTTALASSTLGAVSWLNYAFRLFQFPVGILSVSIANSNLVHFSEAWKNKEKEKAANVLQLSYFSSWLTLIPSTFLLYILSTPTVHLILERGKFTFQDTLMSSVALQLYAIGLPFYGLYKVFVPTFYAIDRQKIPVVSSLTCVLFNIVFCVFLFPSFGFKILPLGTTLSMFFNSLILCVLAKKLLDLPWSFFIHTRLLKLLGATLPCIGILSYSTDRFFHYSDTIWMKWSVFMLLGLMGLGSYFFLILLLGEGKILREIFMKRRKRKSK